MKFSALVLLLLAGVCVARGTRILDRSHVPNREPQTLVVEEKAATQAANPQAAVEPPASRPAASQPQTRSRPKVLAALRQRRQRRTEVSAPPFRLVSAERDSLLRQFFPKVENSELRRILADPELIVYTEEEMPKAYQFFDGAFPGVHSAMYNISANGSEPFGNGNREFPWSSPVGTHRSSNVGSFRFLYLPRDAQGRPWPVVWYSQVAPGESSYSYAWTFPVGAVVGEVLTMRGPDDHDYTFELRVRRREVGFWEVDVLRPFPTAKSLAKRIRQLRPDWQSQPQLELVCNHLEAAKSMPILTLTDSQPNKRAFTQTLAVDDLPALGDDKLVAQLLQTTVFRSATGENWRELAWGMSPRAPTTQAAFHVIPANYDAGFVSVDSKSCARCHDTVNEPVRSFNAGRDWYGRIRGSDGIFSFHPFALSSISGNGYSAPVQMRTELQSAGIVSQFDPRIHTSDRYQQLYRSETSL